MLYYVTVSEDVCLPKEVDSVEKRTCGTHKRSAALLGQPLPETQFSAVIVLSG